MCIKLPKVLIYSKSIGFFVFLTYFTSGILTDSKAEPPNQKKLITILAIDGGGVRGIIPAMVLAELESQLGGKHLTDVFDIIAGTSTGGLISLLLSVPDKHGHPKYTASMIVDIYKELGPKVFYNSFWQSVKSGCGWWDAKYSEKPLEKNLEEYFGKIKLSQTLTQVLIPAYEIEKDLTFFFKSNRAKNELHQNCFLKDLARATSAAPTYFRPARIRDDNGRTLSLIDGGVSVNNPALAAAVYAIELYGKENIELFIVSLGTGTTYGAKHHNISYEDVSTAGIIGWSKKLISMMMYATNSITDYHMFYVFNNHMPKHYFRFQSILEVEHSDMDNASPENMKALKKYAQTLIAAKKDVLTHIAHTLLKHKYDMKLR